MVENNKQLKYHAISVMSKVVTRHDGIVEESLCLVFKQSNFPAGFEINPTLLPFKSLLPFNFHDIIQLRTPSTLMIPSLLVASSPPTSETKKNVPLQIEIFEGESVEREETTVPLKNLLDP